jgi:Domain of unknown function (DUF6471)
MAGRDGGVAPGRRARRAGYVRADRGDSGAGRREARPRKEAEITYAELARRLKKHGFKDETEAGITMKLKRGTFSASFFLACLAAMELEGVVLEEI